MKNIVRSLAIAAACLVSALPALAQSGTSTQTPLVPYPAKYAVKPFPGGHNAALQKLGAPAPAVATIPLANFKSYSKKDGQTYNTIIVGQDPGAANPTTTVVNVKIVPLIVNIGSNNFNPNAANTCGGMNGLADVTALKQSPLFTPVPFDGIAAAGHAAKINGVAFSRGTYIDQLRRAEFLYLVTKAKIGQYHTTFNLTVTPKQTLFANATNGHSAIIADFTSTSPCYLLGGLEINWFDNYLQNTLLPAVGATPDTFVIILMHNVVMYDTTTANCCILGFHGALSNFQTYSPMDYDTTNLWGGGVLDASVAAHEIGEWLDDPLGTNPTPLWGNIGQVSGCQGNWENGDPLSGTLFPTITAANGVQYHMQDMAFWAWFYDKNLGTQPGAGGKFTMAGTFTGPAKVCNANGTGGGTF